MCALAQRCQLAQLPPAGMVLARDRCCIVKIFLLLVLHLSRAAALADELINKEVFRTDLLQHGCNSERGPLSFEHEEWIERLDRKRIVFIGDSITRYGMLFCLWRRSLALSGAFLGCVRVWAS